jgi:ABC-type transport system involved in multi-copper enzyme maturation permease subunit
MSVGLAEALSAEIYRFRRRRLAKLGLAAVAAGGFLGAIAPKVAERATAVGEALSGGAGRDPGAPANAYLYFADGMKGAAILAALLVALAGASAVAGDAASGTLRVSLARPVRRIHLFAAKALVIALFLEVALLVGTAAAAAGAAIVADFGPVVRFGVVQSSGGAMAASALFALLLSELAILGILGLSLLSSTLAGGVASAMSAALGVLGAAALAAFAFPDVQSYLFPSFTTSAFDTLRSHALAVVGSSATWFGRLALRPGVDAVLAAALPAASAAILLGAAARAFTRRDWLA